MLDELTIDELRWLKASEILDFTASTESLNLDDDLPVSEWPPCLATATWLEARTKRQQARSSRARHAPPKCSDSFPSSKPSPACQSSEVSNTPWASSLPTPPSTPTRLSSSRNSPLPTFHDPSTQWLYRRPREPTTPRGSPAQSARSSSLTVNQLPPLSKTLAGTQSSTSLNSGTKKPKRLLLGGLTPKEDSPSSPKIKGGAPFWSTVLRTSPRSGRPIPFLKTIPSKTEVTVHPPIFSERKSELSPDDFTSIKSKAPSSFPVRPVVGGAQARLILKSPSISSSLSSSSSHSSSRPETPVTPSDTYGTKSLPKFLPPNKGAADSNHHRYGSLPAPPSKLLAPPLSCSSPSKSILARSASVCTRDSVAVGNKSVKFAAVPVVHYTCPLNSKPFEDAMQSRFVEDVFGPTTPAQDMDVDTASIDSDSRPHHAVSRTAHHRERPRPYQAPKDAPSRATLNDDGRLERNTRADTTLFAPGSVSRSSSFRKLMSLTTKKSADKPPATIKSPHYVPNSASRSMPPPRVRPTSTKPSSRPSISGPYALGSLPPSTVPSPAASTTSLQSSLSTSKSCKDGRERAFFSPSSTGASPGVAGAHASVPSSYSTGGSSLENYKANRNLDARSVRSFASVKSSKSAITTSGLSSLFSRISAAAGKPAV